MKWTWRDTLILILVALGIIALFRGETLWALSLFAFARLEMIDQKIRALEEKP